MGEASASEAATAVCEVVPATQARVTTLRVEVGGAVVHVGSGFDAELLHDVVAALTRRSA